MVQEHDRSMHFFLCIFCLVKILSEANRTQVILYRRTSPGYPTRYPRLSYISSLADLPLPPPLYSVISSTLQTQHAIFLSLAAKTATVDAELQKIKALYTQLWRAKTGSMRDPFSDLDRGSGGDFGMESLRVT